MVDSDVLCSYAQSVIAESERLLAKSMSLHESTLFEIDRRHRLIADVNRLNREARRQLDAAKRFA